MNRYADDVPELELADYQRALRLLLRHPLVTAGWPDVKALPRVRRFATALRRDLSDAFGYRLELHGSTARLVRTSDRLDPTRPALSRTGRPFDRQRYAYLCLCLAVLGRAGIQIALSELADSVAADASRISGLGLEADSGADRRAFVDAVGWLEDRGVLRLADGSTSAWANDPHGGEALYDISREAVLAVFLPARVIQHIDSVAGLLDRSMATSGNAERRAAAQAARRAVVEAPVVYFTDVPEPVANHLRGSALAADVHRLTGLRLERRAEGVLLVDTAGFSADRFPGAGSVAQAAVLLVARMAEAVTDPDGRRVRRLPPADRTGDQRALAAAVDAGLPSAGVVHLDELLPDDGPPDLTPDSAARGSVTDGNRLPFITDGAVRATVTDILDRYRPAFGAQWHADPQRLGDEAVALLERFGAVSRVPGGVLVRPLAGRYRGTVAQVRARESTRDAAEALF